jgi:hypothetical protein
MSLEKLFWAKFNYTCDSNKFRKTFFGQVQLYPVTQNSFFGQSSNKPVTQMSLEKLSLGKV